MPKTETRIDGGTVDLFSDTQGVLFLNDLQWTPRPIFQSYAAYTPRLLAANAEFFRGPSAPQFAILGLRPIDDRLPAIEDGLALHEIVTRYQPVLREKGYLLFERNSQAAERGAALRDETRSLQFGESTRITSNEEEYQTLELSIQSTLVGRIRQTAHRAPVLNIEIATDRATRVFRIIPSMVASEFLLSPLVTNTGSLLDLYRPGRGAAVRSIRVTGDDRGNFDPTIGLRLRSYPRPRIGNQWTDADFQESGGP